MIFFFISNEFIDFKSFQKQYVFLKTQSNWKNLYGLWKIDKYIWNKKIGYLIMCWKIIV